MFVCVRACARVFVCVFVRVFCVCLCVCVWFVLLCVLRARACVCVCVARACVDYPRRRFFTLSHLTRFRLRKNWHKPFSTIKERIVKFMLHAGGDPVHLWEEVMMVCP